MPTGIYYTPDDDLGVPMFGQSNHFYKVHNNTALESIQRLNVGGGSILPVEDTGMFRSWREDVDYLFASSGFQKIKHTMHAPEYIITPPFLAPLKIYTTSRIFKKGSPQSEEKHHLTWKIPVIMSALTILLAIVNAAFYQLRHICEHELVQDKHVQLAPDEPSCHHLSLAEILLATRNFDDALVVGRGGFGKVYKGLVYRCPEVLDIKRLKPDSNQGANEFWREIETLSKLRHIHLVPLIGYCNENEEMILVYQYMPRGTIADNIYKDRKNGNDGIPLSWEQRLKICIGAARGLDYLHTGTQYSVIHQM